MKSKPPKGANSLNILLSNGRFPVAIDLARQLRRAGHTVYAVDPMHYHVCKFSNVVKKSFQVAAPRDDAAGYIAGVKKVVKEEQIDLIIPLHEEIFYLAECDDREILDRLFAPPLDKLMRLHDKWWFNKFLERIGLDCPKSKLCYSMDDVRALDRTMEWAVKPVFGRAASKVYHLKPEEPIPDIDISNEEHYIAQEWLHGLRYCSYSVLRDGQLRALSVYPVKDTIDGSSCVYFESTEHKGIQNYVEKIAEGHPGVTGQVAFDFIETKEGRLVAIECNPRATSGIHLYSGHKDLARCITEPSVGVDGEVVIPRNGSPPRKIAPGMLMVPRKSHATMHEYLLHLKRLVRSRDVTFAAYDPLPSLMQPFLVTSYYKICQEKGGINIPTMFQMDLVWEPVGEHLEKVRTMLKHMAEESEKEGPRDEIMRIGEEDTSNTGQI
ncbi:unnamed protein product [Calypogeia fissa]